MLKSVRVSFFGACGAKKGYHFNYTTKMRFCQVKIYR